MNYTSIGLFPIVTINGKINKMKIGFIATEQYPVPPIKGGAVETWIYEVGKRLSSNNDVYSFCIFDPGIKDWECGNSLRIITYKKGLLAKTLLSTYKLPFKNDDSQLFFIPYSFWCAKILKRMNADIIHIHSRPQFVPILRLFNRKAKIILHIHNVGIMQVNNKVWNKSLLDKVDSVVTCSNYLKNEVIKLYPYLKGKTHVLYNGVDTNTFYAHKIHDSNTNNLRIKYGIKKDEIVILFAGRLVEYKGAHILIEAFKNLTKNYSNLKLILLGSITYSINKNTPYIKSLKDTCRDIENSVIFTGYIPHKEVPNFLKLADLFVVPSIWEEPFGVVTIEAMSMEKPVIAFSKGGIKEIITNQHNGILLDDSSQYILQKKIKELIDNPDLRTKLGKTARISIIKNFEWSKIVNDVFNFYSSLN